MNDISERRSGVPTWSGIVVVLFGLLAFFGWVLGIHVLTQPVHDAASMKANTALTLVAFGLALIFLSTRRFTRAAVMLSALSGMLAMLTLSQDLFGFNLGIDELLTVDVGSLAGHAGGRMAPLTAVCQLAIAIALIASLRPKAGLSQSFALIALLVSTVVSVGYLYEVRGLVAIGSSAGMAPHTAVLLVLLSVGVIFLQLDKGVMKVLSSNGLGGRMARRTLPATIAIPVLLGWLRLEGERAGLYGTKLGPPLIVFGTMILLSIVVWLNARLLDEIDGRRKAADEALRVANRDLEIRVAEKTAEALSNQQQAAEALRVTEDRLRAGQRMEALGQLAGGIAHDFNNMMTIVTGYSELLLTHHHITHEVRRSVQEIRKAGDRCATLTRHLLAFGRRQILTPSVVDLNSIVHDLSNMLPMLVGEGVSVTVNADPGLGNVLADPAQVEQVIVNLVVNARDAMPSGGTLTIETRNIQVDERTTSLHRTIPPGPYVLLAVADSGIGMDAETRARAFDPFFTTKPTGRGTGLGLSTVYGVIKQSDAYLDLESALGEGTTFRIYFPRIEGVPPAVPAPGPSRTLCGLETVLIVEDEESLRHLLREVLSDAGYSVLEAPNGEQALHVSQSYGAPIHLVITDVVMPGMSGMDLVEQFGRVRPETKALLISGHAQHLIVQQAVGQGTTPYLQKPFTPDGLLAKTRDVLDSGPRGAAK